MTVGFISKISELSGRGIVLYTRSTLYTSTEEWCSGTRPRTYKPSLKFEPKILKILPTAPLFVFVGRRFEFTESILFVRAIVGISSFGVVTSWDIGLDPLFEHSRLQLSLQPCKIRTIRSLADETKHGVQILDHPDYESR